MNCIDMRRLLAGLVYGDLTAEQELAATRHLEECLSCRAEHSALVHVRSQLDRASQPKVEVDLPRLYQQALREQDRRVRRWRRAGIALLATAAGLLVLSILNLELRLEGHQLVLRWGNPPELPQPAPEDRAQLPKNPVVAAGLAPDALKAAELQALRKLVHALAENNLGRDWEQVEGLRQVHERLDLLEGQLREQSETSRRYFAALATAQLQGR